MARFPAGVLLLLLATAVWAQDKPASGSKPATTTKSLATDSGAIINGIYRNSAFGFSYKLPYGWVDRTADMQDDSADASSSRLLLAVFERPPEATGDTMNSAVVIAAELLPAGMKTAAEYFESLSALATAKGLSRQKKPRRILSRQHKAGARRLQQAAGNADHASDFAGPGGEGLRNFVYFHWRE